MVSIKLDDLTLAELKQLQKSVAKAIDGYTDRKKHEALEALQAKAQEMGFSLSDLIGVKKTRKNSSPIPSKYRHPENPEITWSGRGRQPGWFKAAIDAETSEESLMF